MSANASPAFITLLAFASCTHLSGAVGLQTQGVMRSETPFQASVPLSSKATSLEGEINELALNDKQKLWWDLTKDLHKHEGFATGKDFDTFSGGHETVLRIALNTWTTNRASDLKSNGMSGLVCGETGDGHFLKGWFKDICKSSLVVDKYDQAAPIKMDLNLPPDQAPASVKAARETLDLVVSHQVFEHLAHPTIGIANINSLLKKGGRLIFSTPFVVQDHQDPFDYFRYTVRTIHELLKCAGFDVQTLNGLGSRLEDIAYVAGVSSEMDSDNLSVVCDGLTTNDCGNMYYTAVAAVGIKTKTATIEEIRSCFT